MHNADLVDHFASLSGLHLQSHSAAWHSSQIAVLYSRRAVMALASGRVLVLQDQPFARFHDGKDEALGILLDGEF
jgi:hypothetical protein